MINSNIATNGKKLTEKSYANSLGEKEMIGYLNGPFNNLVLDNMVSIDPNVSIVDLSKYLKSACGLASVYTNSRYFLAITDYANSSLNMLERVDSYMHTETQSKAITKIKEIRFKKYYAICTNESSFLYVCDMELDRVLIFDLESNLLKRIISGLGANGEESRRLEFNCPRDVCFFKHTLYVLEQ